jgi:hypothetical protein
MLLPLILFENISNVVSQVKLRTGSSVPAMPHQRRAPTHITTPPANIPSTTHVYTPIPQIRSACVHTCTNNKQNKNINHGAPLTQMYARTADVVRVQIQVSQPSQIAHWIERSCDRPQRNISVGMYLEMSCRGHTYPHNPTHSNMHIVPPIVFWDKST